MYLVIRYFLRKKLGIPREYPYRYISKKHKTVEIVLSAVCYAAFLAVCIIFDWYRYRYINFYFFGLLGLVVQSFRLFMEIKYNKESKHYLLSLVDYFFTIFMLIAGLIFLPLK